MKRARVIEEHKTNYIISTEGGEFVATVRGSFFTEETFPKVGDYVLCSEVADGKAVIEEIIPRTSTIARRAVETGDEQVIVANVDIIFIVMGLDNDFNVSRLERYLLLAKQSETDAIVILNKSDSVDEVDSFIEQAKEAAQSVPVYAVSAKTGENMEQLLEHLRADITAVLLGSSGAGKSTITNWLLRENKQEVRNVREDDNRGRHTTTSRQLFSVPTGGYLIDTPGMRELSVLDATADDENILFEKIESLSRECQFSNCDHEKSAGCAVLKAIEDDELSERQLKNYHKIKRERQFGESKKNDDLSREQKQNQKRMHKMHNNIQKQKRFNKRA